MISRRGFLKGLVLLPAVAYFPALLKTPEAKILPFPLEVQPFLPIRESMLDTWAEIHGIVRRAQGESDTSLKKRIRARIDSTPGRKLSDYQEPII